MIRSDMTVVHARLSRADEHVAALRTVIESYTAFPPYRRTRRLVPGKLGRVVERADLFVPAPQHARIIVSDAVHQARAALDNLVNAARTGGPAPRVQFLVRETAEKWEADAPSALEGVPAWLRAFIRRAQPFSDDLGLRWLGERLFLLHDAARLDRHRAPPLHAAFLVPDYGTTAEGANLEFRGDLATWAEAEYQHGLLGSLEFRVDVRFAPEGSDKGEMEVVSGTSYLIESAKLAIEEVLRLSLQNAAE